MAVDQDLLDRIAGTVADLYREVETALVRTVAQRLRKDLPSPFYEEKLDAVRQLQETSRRILAKLQLARAGKIREAVALAYRSGRDAATVDLPESWDPSVGPAARRAVQVMPNARLLENIAAALHRDVGRVDANILRAALDAYRAVQAGAAARIASGAYTRREASQAAWQRLMDKGIVDFTDRAGRRWKLSSYVEMMARTNIARAAIQGQTDRLAEAGIDLVYISDNSQECKRCRPFESKVLRRDAGPTGRIQVEHATKDGEMITVDVVDTLDGARSKGLFHPNCRHSASAYLPGVTKLKKNTADPEGDKARQKQRALERRIRAAKEAELGALTPEAKKAARAKVRAAQAAMRDHLKANPKLKRLPYREQIGAGSVPRGEAPGGPVGDLTPPTTPPAAPPAVPAPDPGEQEAARRRAEQERARAAEQARIEQAKKEAAEAARRAAQEAARQRAAAPGMRAATRHRTDADGIAWAHRLPSPKLLPEQQRKAVHAYTKSDDWFVNNGLRRKPPQDPAEQARFGQLVKDLDAAIDSSRTPEPVIVHRTTDTAYTRVGLKVDVDKPEEMAALVGKVFTEPAYWSTSVGKGRKGGSGDIQIMIRVPEGYPALDVMPVSEFGESERELTLRRGARYVFHAAYKKNGAWILEAEIVPDGWTPPPGWAPDPYGPDDAPGG